MKVVRDDIWLCSDCMIAAVNDDYTGLDYYYSPEEADQKMQEIQAGLERLGPHLSMNFDENEGEMEFSEIPCECCGNKLHGVRYRFAILGEEKIKHITKYPWLVVINYYCSLGAPGQVISRHTRYELARAKARQSGYDDFLCIKHFSDIEG